MDYVNKIICGDCLKVLHKLPKATMIFADPPDNLGCKYEGFTDRWKSNAHYIKFLYAICNSACSRSSIFWLSYNIQWQFMFINNFPIHAETYNEFRQKPLIWRYTFGQHNEHDCGSGHRPILRLMREGAELYPDAIRVPSARQIKYNDKRANPKGRVPDDVWEFPRVCGTFKERKKWHPCQHPKELLKRMVLFSTKPGDLVIDMFAGSGNMFEVCRELERDCIGIDISKYYCEKISKEQGIEIIEL